VAEDTRFALPAADDPASTEVGVMLLGLSAERLLAGLGLAGLGLVGPEFVGLDGPPDEDGDADEDPAMIALLVDHVQHGSGPVPMSDAVLAGARRWRAARNSMLIDERMTVSAAPRQAWEQASRAVASDVGSDPATHAYLTACWLRRDEVDRRSAAIVVAGRVGTGGGPSQT
jgi:hypothetical protein